MVTKLLRHLRDQSIVYHWRLTHHIPPPHIVKQQIVLAYARRFNLHTLIETGTYYGQMVEAMKHRFHRIYSVELSPELYERAKAKFSHARNVTILQGNSAEVLPVILEQIYVPCLFWLDAHHSGGVTAKGDSETPLARELEIIVAHRDDHVILIDDARLLGSGDYPSIEETERIVYPRTPTLCDDVLRVTPNSLGSICYHPRSRSLAY